MYRPPWAPDEVDSTARTVARRSLEWMRPRSTAEVAALLGDLTPVGRRTVAAPLGRQDPAGAGHVQDDHPLLAAVGRRD